MAKPKRKTAGLPPGSIIFTGDRKVERIDLHYLEFNEASIDEQKLDNLSITDFHEPNPEMIQWYDVRGLHDTELITQIGNTFQVHPLVLEDIVDIRQRPKFDEYETGSYLAFRSLKFDAEEKKVDTQQISIFFGMGFILSFQEETDDLFESIRNRLRTARGKIRKRGADYLAYALLDATVDHYFFVLDEMETAIESLEEEILQRPGENSKSKIHQLKQEMLTVRKSVFPLREAINSFSKSDSEFISEESQIFIRDLYDHTIQVIDMVETYRDLLNGLQDLYLSEISFRMNQVMQILTIITTIFVPLSFLAGLYGMNFDHIPELHWKYGYFILLGFMLIISIGLLYYFRRKKWL